MLQNEVERRHEEAEAHIRKTIMNEFCEIMHKSGLPPMAVMRLAARSIGMIYREVADAHSGPEACPCGWRPNEVVDVEVLGMALMTACERCQVRDLRHMRIAGTA
ncbi:hypothetical protein [Mesorhizobium sp. INR15]|uniref:hypothetical protein n=1 Tax=Mesorhizobium sp. INR15 TaxID=2654248 RepID=UPI0018969413|nr:hypothetical protein [Mesorhizobium sp. INR15]